MSALSPGQVAALWRKHGGSAASTIVAVTISDAESGLNPLAVSPSDDWGLWQINAIWANLAGGNVALFLDPDINAAAAVIISGGGSNFAAWCTMWANPNADCGHGRITYPQRGSAAYADLGRITAALQGGYPNPNPGRLPSLRTVSDSYGNLARYVAHDAPGQYASIALARAVNREARKRLP